MSWKMTKEVREARLAGQLPGIKSATEFLVLFVMADTCRGESRIASISVTELVTLSDVDRTTIWRAIKKLGDLGYIRKLGRSNQYQTARFEVLPDARCTDATCTESDARCVDATCTEEVHVANDKVHVANEEVHVAKQASARCMGATLPSIPDVIPTKNPEGEGYVSNAREAPTPPKLSNVQSINGGSAGNGNLAGVCVITMNGNGHVPSRIKPSADLVPAPVIPNPIIPNSGLPNPYLHLGFVSSVTEPPLGGITPPSRYCAKHQPSGTDESCWPCGNARRYRDQEWPITERGREYIRYCATVTRMDERQGRHDAPMAEIALRAGRTLAEQQERTIDLLGAVLRANAKSPTHRLLVHCHLRAPPGHEEKTREPSASWSASDDRSVAFV
jgi:hypothetical protein